jgi:hypothetical protein
VREGVAFEVADDQFNDGALAMLGVEKMHHAFV